MHKISGAIRSYAWGSRTAISQLRGNTLPSPHPEAELWFGAHRVEPAKITGTNTSLLEIINNNPVAELGHNIVNSYDNELPFMVKIIAADEPLSLQAHPSKKQAHEGFQRENDENISLNAIERNYKDPHHKPEVIIALGDFELLVGFAQPQSIIDLLTRLIAFYPQEDMRWITDCIELLTAEPNDLGLRAAFTTFLTLPTSTIEQINRGLIVAATRYLSDGKDDSDSRVAHVKAILYLAELYHDDFGVIAATLMNHIMLSYGQAVYVPAGFLHTYLSGVGLEVLGNSDNVLRGGLTPKYVDVPELVRILNFSAHGQAEMLCYGERIQKGVYHYPLDVAEFDIYRYVFDGDAGCVNLSGGSPRILVTIRGTINAVTSGQSVMLGPVEGLWISASDDALTLQQISNEAEFFVISPGM